MRFKSSSCVPRWWFNGGRNQLKLAGGSVPQRRDWAVRSLASSLHPLHLGGMKRSFVFTPTTTTPPTTRDTRYYFQQQLRRQPSLKLYLHQLDSPDSSPKSRMCSETQDTLCWKAETSGSRKYQRAQYGEGTAIVGVSTPKVPDSPGLLGRQSRAVPPTPETG